MNKGLYTRLAFTNMRNNKQFYPPYLIAGIITIGMFYIMLALNATPGLSKLMGASSVRMVLGLGCIVIGIFAVIFLFYTNSFIIKRRKKELGIYNILGMEKKHLIKVLSIETLATAAAAIAGGLAVGIVFNKLMGMLLYYLMGFSTSIEFYVSAEAIGITCILFLAIYFLTLLYDLFQIQLANPMELLHGGNQGEREPKTKIIMAVLGIGCIGAAYYLAITIDNPVAAISLFFVAVILVIIGTYFIFTAGSIAVLKLLRRNKKYYYKAKHFTAVSGMIYRMKQNAAGLANICILSTMVLVVVSTTVSMYIGIEDELESRYPCDISVFAEYPEGDIRSEDEILSAVNQTIAEQGREIKNEVSYLSLSIMTKKEDGGYFSDQNNSDAMDFGSIFTVVTREGYEEMYGEKTAELQPDEVILLVAKGTHKDTICIDGAEYRVADSVDIEDTNNPYMMNVIPELYCLVVNDTEQMRAFYQMQREAYGGEAANGCKYTVNIDIDGNKEEKIAASGAVRSMLEELGQNEQLYLRSESKQENADEFQQMYGGFFFLGVFLGSMFLMITVLIIFYKQISEGYDDKVRFEIMEKVGMSNAEVKASISSQVKTVFLLPILTATVHICAAFPMIRKILVLMNLDNGTLFAGCVAGTVIVFALIYLLVYWITSKTYYKIVGKQV